MTQTLSGYSESRTLKPTFDKLFSFYFTFLYKRRSQQYDFYDPSDTPLLNEYLLRSCLLVFTLSRDYCAKLNSGTSWKGPPKSTYSMCSINVLKVKYEFDRIPSRNRKYSLLKTVYDTRVIRVFYSVALPGRNRFLDTRSSAVETKDSPGKLVSMS